MSIQEELEICVPKRLTRQEFYRFALFRGFSVNTDRKYRPKVGDMVFFDQKNEDDSLCITLGYVMSKFGGQYLRTHHKIGWHDTPLERVNFFGRMVFKNH
ncbi:hypothetical protein HYV56_00855 [Candidatus Peregrinibacteria bacterium]|nr:hypothetical protein [Candidatus Peregrinibacteria bacterium]